MPREKNKAVGRIKAEAEIRSNAAADVCAADMQLSRLFPTSKSCARHLSLADGANGAFSLRAPYGGAGGPYGLVAPTAEAGAARLRLLLSVHPSGGPVTLRAAAGRRREATATSALMASALTKTTPDVVAASAQNPASRPADPASTVSFRAASSPGPSTPAGEWTSVSGGVATQVTRVLVGPPPAVVAALSSTAKVARTATYLPSLAILTGVPV